MVHRQQTPLKVMANETDPFVATENLEGGVEDSSSLGERCCRYTLSELHYSSLCCCYKDNKAFLFSPVSILIIFDYL